MSKFLSTFFKASAPVIQETDDFEVATKKLSEIIKLEKEKTELYTPFLMEWMKQIVTINKIINDPAGFNETRNIKPVISDATRLATKIGVMGNESLSKSLYNYTFMLRLNVKQVVRGARRNLSILMKSLPQVPTQNTNTKKIINNLERRLKNLSSKGGTRRLKRSLHTTRRKTRR